MTSGSRDDLYLRRYRCAPHSGWISLQPRFPALLGNQRSNVEEKFTPEKHTCEPFTQVLGDLGSTLSAKRQQGWVVSIVFLGFLFSFLHLIEHNITFILFFSGGEYRIDK